MVNKYPANLSIFLADTPKVASLRIAKQSDSAAIIVGSSFVAFASNSMQANIGFHLFL